jgi:hypothetical protein
MPVFPEGMGPQRVQVPEVYAPWSKVFFFDAGSGNVALALELAKRCIHCVCVVKQAFSGFPHAWITEKVIKAGRLYGKSWCRRRTLQQHRPPTPCRQGAGTGADQLNPQQAPRLALLPQLAFERLRGVETDAGFPPFNL